MQELNVCTVLSLERIKRGPPFLDRVADILWKTPDTGEMWDTREYKSLRMVSMYLDGCFSLVFLNSFRDIFSYSFLVNPLCSVFVFGGYDLKSCN